MTVEICGLQVIPFFFQLARRVAGFQTCGMAALTAQLNLNDLKPKPKRQAP